MRGGVGESGDGLEEGVVHGDGGGVRSHEANVFGPPPCQAYNCTQLPSCTMFRSGETELNPRQLDARQADLRSPSPCQCHPPLSSTIGHRWPTHNPLSYMRFHLLAIIPLCLSQHSHCRPHRSTARL